MGGQGMAHSDITDEMTALLNHASPEVRLLAIRLVEKMEWAVFRPDLVGLQSDSDSRVQALARRALAQITPNGGRGGEIIRTHGGYEGLKSYRAAEIVYDATVIFCDRFVDRFSRTRDQMIQAARSGKQNIVEASAAAGTSSKTELKLTGVARASLEELLADYRDFLRQRNLPQWDKDDGAAQQIRKMAYIENRSYGHYKAYIEDSGPETAANTAICLIYQATYLLDRQIKQLETAFLEHGGISERMTEARLRHRHRGKEE